MKRIYYRILILISLVGILHSSSFARIIYTNITDIIVKVNGTAGSLEYYSLDLNNDGTNDIKIGAKCYESWLGHHPPYEAFNIFVDGLGDTQVILKPCFANDTISSNSSFRDKSEIYGYVPGFGFTGSFADTFEENNTTTYLGLQLVVNGNIYYGWIKIKLTYNSFTISDFAYNDRIDNQIIAGQTN